jgi:hypothetical protein
MSNAESQFANLFGIRHCIRHSALHSAFGNAIRHSAMPFGIRQCHSAFGNAFGIRQCIRQSAISFGTRQSHSALFHSHSAIDVRKFGIRQSAIFNGPRGRARAGVHARPRYDAPVSSASSRK